MCFGCQCPQSEPSPSELFSKLRIILKVTALILLVFAVLDFTITLNIMSGIFNLLLIYFLYVGWARFDACSVLIFFIFCLLQTVQYLLVIIDKIERKTFFPGGLQTANDVIIIVYFCFYTVSIFVSHYAYKHFKHRVFDELTGGQTYSNLIPGGGRSSPYSDTEQDSRPRPPGPQSQAPARPQQGFNAFAGTAVQIG